MQSQPRQTVQQRPRSKQQQRNELQICIEACATCENKCLPMQGAGMGPCIAACKICCLSCKALLTAIESQCPDEELVESLVSAVLSACDHCMKMCEPHEMEHCQTCATACRRCIKVLFNF